MSQLDQDGAKAPRGQIYKGTAPLKQVPGYKPVSSIPAKFETILFTGPRERKGFGTESKRFGDPDHDLPGPGAYDKSLSMEYKHDSISKKGYGSMISKGQRFNTKVYYTGPGPGEYKKPTTKDIVDFSKAAVSSSFVSKTTLPRKPTDSDSDLPGPGAYSATEVTKTGQKLDYLSKPGATSAFKAAPHKLILSGNPEAPPPNTYSMADPWDKSSCSASRAAGTSFGGGSRGGQSMQSMGTNLNTLLFGAEGGHSKVEISPGPGQYELQSFASIGSTMQKHASRPSPAFQPLEYEERAGHSGRQQADKHAASTADFSPANVFIANSRTQLKSPGKGVGSSFISTSPGHQDYTDQAAYRTSTSAPGPAYYQAQPGKKKSFHMNTRKQYVAAS